VSTELPGNPDGGSVLDSTSPGHRNPADETESGPITANPLGSGFDFRLSMPEVEVRMINAATLGDYEVWIYVASLSFSAVTGFFVAYLQSFSKLPSGKEVSDSSYLVIAVVFFLLFTAFAIRATMLRRKLTQNTKTYRMRAVGED
jgi:hypothetical protein